MRKMGKRRTYGSDPGSRISDKNAQIWGEFQENLPDSLTHAEICDIALADPKVRPLIDCDPETAIAKYRIDRVSHYCRYVTVRSEDENWDGVPARVSVFPPRNARAEVTRSAEDISVSDDIQYNRAEKKISIAIDTALQDEQHRQSILAEEDYKLRVAYNHAKKFKKFFKNTRFERILAEPLEIYFTEKAEEESAAA